MKHQFETQECSRCKGSGKYSFCEEYRDVCFKCAGSGKTLTKRGMAGQKFFLEMCQIEISELKVGDLIRVENLTSNMRRFSYKAKIVEINRSKYEVSGSNGNVPFRYFPLAIITDHPKYGRSGISGKDDQKVRIYREDDLVRFQRALEYQGTLTKSGTAPGNKNLS